MNDVLQHLILVSTYDLCCLPLFPPVDAEQPCMGREGEKKWKGHWAEDKEQVVLGTDKGWWPGNRGRETEVGRSVAQHQ